MAEQQTQHTPGPWRLRTDGEQSCGVEDGPLVEVVAEDGTVVCCNERYYPTAVEPCNARLIAAAPDMLAALPSVANSDMAMLAEDEGRPDPVLDEVRGVIKKATETPND